MAAISTLTGWHHTWRSCRGVSTRSRRWWTSTASVTACQSSPLRNLRRESMRQSGGTIRKRLAWCLSSPTFSSSNSKHCSSRSRVHSASCRTYRQGPSRRLVRPRDNSRPRKTSTTAPLPLRARESSSVSPVTRSGFMVQRSRSRSVSRTSALPASASTTGFLDSKLCKRAEPPVCGLYATKLGRRVLVGMTG